MRWKVFTSVIISTNQDLIYAASGLSELLLSPLSGVLG
ncbi:hypothetical protein ERS140159_02342 [Staphylococcus schweitzeri]|nr:hypothetical protein ERS140159_02342 [Staphylococcus schweitzeri]